MAKAKSGKWRCEKVEYEDGIGGCLWETIPGQDEDIGLALDFSDEEVDDIIRVLLEYKKMKADIYIPEEDDE